MFDGPLLRDCPSTYYPSGERRQPGNWSIGNYLADIIARYPLSHRFCRTNTCHCQQRRYGSAMMKYKGTLTSISIYPVINSEVIYTREKSKTPDYKHPHLLYIQVYPLNYPFRSESCVSPLPARLPATARAIIRGEVLWRPGLPAELSRHSTSFFRSVIDKPEASMFGRAGLIIVLILQ